MDSFKYEPTDEEVARLVTLTATPGWAVFDRIMRESYQQAAVQGIEELSGADARPAGYYKGYLDSIMDTLGRVDTLIQILISKRQEENDAERFSPARGLTSSGDTAS